MKPVTYSPNRLATVLIGPIVSEKATMLAEEHNQVLFEVVRDATKPEIKAAVEMYLKVAVHSVQVLNRAGKQKRFGRSIGRRNHSKKAFVVLKPGEVLNFSGESA